MRLTDQAQYAVVLVVFWVGRLRLACVDFGVANGHCTDWIETSSKRPSRHRRSDDLAPCRKPYGGEMDRGPHDYPESVAAGTDIGKFLRMTAAR